jgi:hypothetical protein
MSAHARIRTKPRRHCTIRATTAEQQDKHTCGVGELILLALYPILEGLGVATGYLNALLNRICSNVRHLAGRLFAGAVVKEVDWWR